MAPDRPQPSLAAYCGAESWRQPEWRVLIGDQGERVADDAVVSAEDALDEAEHAAPIAAGEQDGEPGRYHDEEQRDFQEEQHDVVRDGEQPFDQWQPPVEVSGGVWIGVVQPDPLVVKSRSCRNSALESCRSCGLAEVGVRRANGGVAGVFAVISDRPAMMTNPTTHAMNTPPSTAARYSACCNARTGSRDTPDPKAAGLARTALTGPLPRPSTPGIPTGHPRRWSASRTCRSLTLGTCSKPASTCSNTAGPRRYAPAPGADPRVVLSATAMCGVARA
jgi:hypothetical protein